MTDSRTKAELVDALDEARDCLDEMRERLRDAEASTRRTAVPEAIAFAACVNAINAMLSSPERRDGQLNVGWMPYPSYGEEFIRRMSKVEKLLRALALHYDERLIDTAPCSRKHLDQINSQRITEAVLGAVS